MKSGKIKYYTSNFFWGFNAKVVDALLKFISIPILITHFGKDYYGLLSLAIATNAYMILLDMSMNTGAIKYFSQWISSQKYLLLEKVIRTNITFYILIGVINSILLVFIGLFGNGLFHITSDQFTIFQKLLFILSIFSTINWVNYVFNQLLIASEKMSFTQKMLIVKSLLNVLLVLFTYYYNIKIDIYFLIFVLINSLLIIPNYLLCKKLNLIRSIIPGFYWNEFKIILNYSLAIFAMGLFQYTATQSRPIILGMFYSKGINVLTEYRIIEVFTISIISLGGMLISILLPKTSQAIEKNNNSAIEKLAYVGTKYTSILVIVLCMPIIISSREIITLYVGASYSHLSFWLSIWLFTIIIFLHNIPVASLVLATGKTKMLVYSAAFASITSIIINILLCNSFGVGSAVIGYLVYIMIQMSFYYIYFNKKVLKLNSKKIFISFIVPTLLSIISGISIYLLNLIFKSLLFTIIVKSFLWILFYLILLFVSKTISLSSIKKFL